MKTRELYFYWIAPAFALGIGAGKVKGTKIWDFSISLGFFIVGFRIYNYTEEEYAKALLEEVGK